MNDAREGGGRLSRRAFVRVAATAAVAACVRTREESGPMANPVLIRGAGVANSQPLPACWASNTFHSGCAFSFVLLWT